MKRESLCVWPAANTVTVLLQQSDAHLVKRASVFLILFPLFSDTNTGPVAFSGDIKAAIRIKFSKKLYSYVTNLSTATAVQVLRKPLGNWTADKT